MAWIYAAHSKSLAKWGESVGLSKHLYKLGLIESAPDGIAAALNDAHHAGRSDWTVIKKEKLDHIAEAELLARLAEKEQPINPTYYPAIKDAHGIFKVKLDNISNHLLVVQALGEGELKAEKLTPAKIGTYLIAKAKPPTAE